MPDPDPAFRMLTVAEVVQRTGMTEYAVRQAIKSGELGSRRRGRSLYVPEHALETYVSGVAEVGA